MFDQKEYEKVLITAYPVDNIDPTHTWSLLNTIEVEVTTDVGAQNVAKVQILNKNPFESTKAKVLAERYAKQGERVAMTVDIPVTQKTLYAAVVTRSGKYYLRKFTPDESQIVFTSTDTPATGTVNTPAVQAYTYLYEESFPMPDDFDYNDVVMRISKSVPSANILQLKVTLSAVGASRSIAGALRLTGIAYNDVVNVTIDSTAMDDGYPLNFSMLDGKVWSKSRKGEAVINLFEDAFWAIRPQTATSGDVLRRFYNTERQERENYSARVAEKTRTYTVLLKDGADANNIRLSQLDPFIIKNYNNVHFEVHTYPFHTDEVLWEYQGGDKTAYIDVMAWALLIPDGDFAYPMEGMPIGTYRNGEIFGAYGKYHHSFGEWLHDKEKAIDWWIYPTKPMTYY
jgi:LruC domain-containing protein